MKACGNRVKPVQVEANSRQRLRAHPGEAEGERQDGIFAKMWRTGNFYTIKLRLMLVPLLVEGEVLDLAEEHEEELYMAA